MDGRIYYLIQEISNNLSRNWSIRELATLIGLSVPHLQKLFKSTVRMSPYAYLQELRLEKARELLETTFLQVKQIGYQTGLRNDSHFTRDFKRKFGMTPTEYRKKYLERSQGANANGMEKVKSAKK